MFLLECLKLMLFFTHDIVCTENGVSISITVGVVSVAVVLVFSMGGFILAMIAGTYRTKSQ